jgi:hypothetical protein
MAKYKITTADGTFVVDAPDVETATAALEQHSAQNYEGKTDANGVPEGMVFDPATNRMVDARALAQQATPGGSITGAAIKGIPFLGEYADELAGYFSSSPDTAQRPNESQTIQTQVARESQKLAEENYPKTTLAAKIGAGISTLPAAIEFAPAALTQGSLLGRSVLGATAGATLGGVEGAVSGYGEGGGDKRMESAADRAKWSAATGAVLGGTMPAIADATQAGVKKLLDKFTVDRQVNALGIKRPAADALSATLRADDTLGPTGMMRLKKAGDDAMLADGGDTAAGLLDTVIQKSNSGGRIAQAAVERRATEAGQKLKGTMDIILGKPQGVDKAARDISAKTSAVRRQAYDKAHSMPIDYATEAGRKIEDVFARTPPSIMRAAIKEANDSMIAAGERNMQIMANIADDGTVTFRKMPNMKQVDELKRALNFVSETEVDQFGRMNAAGLRAAKLAKELRNAAVKAVPEYADAVKLGGDKIAEDKALKLGYELLRPSTTREHVAEAVDDITDAERKQLALGLRQHIDDTMANVTHALTDGNIDAREAAKALKDMSSRSAREKLTLALGDKRASPLFAQLDKAQAAISLKAATVANSKTFARQEAAKAVEGRRDSVLDRIKEGRPLEAPRTAWQKLTGADANSRLAEEEAIYADIAKVLTGPRGKDAQIALQRLEAAYKAGTLNKATAHKVGQLLVGAADLSAYQFSTQELRK